MALLNLNLSDVSAEDSFSPLPAGEYNAQITETEIKQTNAGDGSYIKATFEIMDGQYAKRKIFHNFNIQNRNVEAVKIGLSQLKQVATFGGHQNPDMIQDTSELHLRPVGIVVVVKPAQGEYGPSNQIKGFKKMIGAGPSASPSFAPPAGANSAPAAGGKPWERK